MSREAAKASICRLASVTALVTSLKQEGIVGDEGLKRRGAPDIGYVADHQPDVVGRGNRVEGRFNIGDNRRDERCRVSGKDAWQVGRDVIAANDEHRVIDRPVGDQVSHGRGLALREQGRTGRAGNGFIIDRDMV